MNGTGNNFSTLFEKLLFMLMPSAFMRTRYIYRQARRFHHVGKDLLWQPRKFPADPELISIGDNVRISADVMFVNHDMACDLLNTMETEDKVTYHRLFGCIEIGDNVMIGARAIILPNVTIGSNVIIGAGAVVTKDNPDNSIAAGVPCRRIGSFEAFRERAKDIPAYQGPENCWMAFKKNRRAGFSFSNKEEKQ